MENVVDNFPERFRRWVTERPDHPALVFLEQFDAHPQSSALTYRQLAERVEKVAAGLRRAGMAGSRVLLLHPAGLEFGVALLACLHAGVVAVPAPPPDSTGRGAARLAGIVSDAGIRCVLAGSAIAAGVHDWLVSYGQADAVSCVTEADLAAGASGEPTELPPVDPHDLAFLQYTSGSTSDPKGVMVTHAALVHNERLISEALELTTEVRCVAWLPHYHDMGLVGQLLAPLWNGGTTYLMAPVAFLKRPQRWMQMVSQLRADFTVGPDFAYALAARRTTDADLAELDLRHLRAALNGSEPIHAATLDRFVARFAPAGLRADIMAPCYGMAETTLMVTCTPPRTGHVVHDVDAAALEGHRLAPATAGSASRRLVSSGRAGVLDVRIVDPTTGAPLLDGAVGEIWVSGPSVAAGYWARPELTAATFHARIPGSDRPYLRTGDLGALSGGDLFVTGRIKEMLIVNGRNLYPQDIERTIRSAHPLAANGTTAVFGINGPRQHDAATVTTVAVQEVRPADLRSTDPDALVAALRTQVRAEHDVHLGTVVLVPTGAVARTTSGKVQRGVMRTAFLDGTLRVLHAAGTPVTAR